MDNDQYNKKSCTNYKTEEKDIQKETANKEQFSEKNFQVYDKAKEEKFEKSLKIFGIISLFLAIIFMKYYH